MNGDTFTCNGPICAGTHWTATRVEGAVELWRIGDGPADPGFLVAAPEPICPRCGERLTPMLELRGVRSHVRDAA